MIMQNDIYENECNNSKRVFTSILEAARLSLHIFIEDPENLTARGILETRNGTFPVELSFDDDKRHLRIFVILRNKNLATSQQLQSFLRFQNYTNFGMSFVTFDNESRAFHIKSQGRLPHPDLSQFVVMSIVTDLRKILEDDTLKNIMCEA